MKKDVEMEVEDGEIVIRIKRRQGETSEDVKKEIRDVFYEVFPEAREVKE